MSSQVNDFDPRGGDYARESGRLVVPCVVLGVLVGISFLLFFLVRCCCFCAGNGCCAKNKTPASRCTVFGYCICALILLTAAVLGGAVLASSGPPVSNSLGGLADTLVEQVDKLRIDLLNIIQTIINTTPQNSTLDVSELQDASNDLVLAGNDVRSARESLDRVLQIIQQVVIVVGVFVIVCAATSGLSLRISVLYIFFFFAMVTCVVTWLLGGVGTAVYVIVKDTCTAMDLHVQGVRNIWLDSIFSCADIRQASDGLNTAMESANLAITDANNEIDEANSQALAAAAAAAGVYTAMPLMCLPYVEVNGQWRENTDPSSGCVPMRQDSVQQEYLPRVCDEVTFISGNLATNAQYQLCVANNRPLKREQYDRIFSAASSFEQIADILPALQSIVSCEFVDDTFEAINEKDCPKLKESTKMLSQSAVIAATFLTISAFYLCVCIRNVRPQDSEYVVGSGAEDTDKSSPATKLNQSGPQADSAPIMAMV